LCKGRNKEQLKKSFFLKNGVFSANGSTQTLSVASSSGLNDCRKNLTTFWTEFLKSL
jgi:hypothetical protein